MVRAMTVGHGLCESVKMTDVALKIRDAMMERYEVSFIYMLIFEHFHGILIEKQYVTATL